MQALIIIDAQKGFDDPCWGKRNNPQAEQNIASLLAAWRGRSMPVIHIKHCSADPRSPLHPDHRGNDYKDEARPRAGEQEFNKKVNSAFIGTRLKKHLQRSDLSRLLIAGFTTDHCVSTTVRMAGNLGFDVVLAEDATATFNRVGVDGARHTAEDIHNIHLASLNGEFCQVQTTAEILRCLPPA